MSDENSVSIPNWESMSEDEIIKTLEDLLGRLRREETTEELLNDWIGVSQVLVPIVLKMYRDLKDDRQYLIGLTRNVHDAVKSIGYYHGIQDVSMRSEE